MFQSKASTMTTAMDETKKSVRINDKAQDLEQLHTARVARQLRRMKRKLLLDAMADDPTNAGYAGHIRSGSSSSLMNEGSNSSIRYEDDEEDNGEAAFRRGRMVRYHAPSGSLTFDSTSSIYSDMNEMELQDINQMIQERRDAALGSA